MLNKLQRMANTIITGGTTITATQTPEVVDPNIRLDMGGLCIRSRQRCIRICR